MVDNFKTYTEYAENTSSEKITLAHVSCKQRLYGFTRVGSTNVYFKVTDHFVLKCQDGVTVLTQAASAVAVTSGTFYFDIETSTLYVYSALGFLNAENDPEIIPIYRLFYSSAPINLSWDLGDNSQEVYYEPRIKSSPGFASKLDNDQTGISVAGSGTLKITNGDRFFKDFYDLLVFENQEVVIYSYNRSLYPSDAKILYRGSITDKTYSNTEISFKVKDVINSLFEEIPLGKFSEITDTININSEIGKYVKRRLYGFVDSLRCQSVDMLYDAVLDNESFTLSGTVSGILNSNVLSGTNFLTEVSPQDIITINETEYTVDGVQSNTVLILSDVLSVGLSAATAKITPSRPWYNSNRKFLICGHALHDITTTISTVVERNRIHVTDASGFKVNDYVDINGQYIQIKRISGDKFILRQNLNLRPTVGDSVTKEKIQQVQVRYPERDYSNIILNRGDYSVSETSEGSYLTITDDAEKNASLARILPGTYYMIKGFDMMWLGKPSIFQITCLANTSGSLYGKYFTMKSDGKDVIFYFSEMVDADEDETEEPTFDYTYTASASTDQVYIAGTTFANGSLISFDATGLPGGLSSGFKYFIREVSGNYFKLSTEADNDTKNITSNGGGTATIDTNTIEILLTSDNLTSTQVAEAVSESIGASLDTYITKNTSNYVTAYTKAGIDIIVGSAGDSGFTIQKLMEGVEPDQAISVPDQVMTRDWVQGYGTSDSGYQEVMEVYSKSLRMRETFPYDSGLYRVQAKNVGYVKNNSHLYIHTAGKLDSSDDLITEAPFIVKDLLIEGDLEDRLNLDSFTRAAVNLPYEMSLKIPYEIDDAAPVMKDVIDDINKTILGSLVIVDDLELAYNALDVERISQSLPVIYDADQISWSVKSTGDSYKYMIAQYNFTDIPEIPSTEYLYTSDFASKYSDSELTMAVDLYLYNQSEAEEAAQRRLYYNTLSRADVTIKGSLNLGLYEMGDKVILSLDGLYNRLGNSTSNIVMGVVSSVKRDGEKVTLIVSTQGGNIFSKVAVITDNSSPDFDAATDEERLYSSFIVGEDGTIDNQSDLLGCNAIA